MTVQCDALSDHVGIQFQIANQNVPLDDNAEIADEVIPLEIADPLPMPAQRTDLPLSPAAMDFEASGGIDRAEGFFRCDEVFQNIDVEDSPADQVATSLGLGDSAAPVPLHSVLDQVLNNSSHPSLHSSGSLANINQVIINLDTLIPASLAKSEALWQLAKVLVDEAVPMGVDQDQEMVILDKMPPVKIPGSQGAMLMSSS